MMLPNTTVLCIGFVWPEPRATAAGGRILQLLDFFRRRGCRLVFASTASETPLSMDFTQLQVEKVHSTLNDPSFDSFLEELKPQIVLFDRFLTEEQFGWRVAEFAPQAVRILDTEDLHSLRKVREQAVKSGVPFTLSQWLQDARTKREMASIFRCDLSLIISTYEMQLLEQFIEIDKGLLLHVPFLLENITGKEEHAWPSFEERQDFIWFGNGNHTPNVDALLWTKAEIWPAILKQMPEAQLKIYGAYYKPNIKRLHDPKTGFIFKGWTESVHATMQNARINLAPLRFGAGIKGKITDAMQNGTPTITTGIGAEGMHGDYNWAGAIEDDPVAFADAAVRFYSRKPLWEKAQKNGAVIINGLYDRSVLEKTLEQRIHGLLQNLETHRNKNFIGAMLMHHTLQSTKFKAKWIESKQKPRQEGLN